MNIIITGGSKGIGREIALSLSQDRDNQILITGRNENTLKKTAGSASNDNISWFAVDFSKGDEQIKYLVGRISSLFSIVDILVNNAGALVKKKISELSDEEIRLMMEVNYFAPVILVRALLPMMRKGSHILNISSMSGFQGSAKFGGLSCYSASKAALSSLTECLAGELSGSGISVNCLALGSVQTEMFAEAFPGYVAPVNAPEMGKFIAYFALNGNRFFNGKIIPVALTTP
jgi:NAD(P)-dependent dehydrogenase (short-subunit alcohol dehydrogenase family)